MGKAMSGNGVCRFVGTLLAGLSLACGLLPGCSGRAFSPDAGPGAPSPAVDSLVAHYRDSMAVMPRRVIELFSAARARQADSLSFYTLLSYESRCYYYLNRMDEALRTNGRVIAYGEPLAADASARRLLADAYNNRGVYWQERGGRDSALVALRRAEELLLTVPGRDRLPSVCMNLADCYMQAGNYPLCGFYYRRALFVTDSLGRSDHDRFAIYSGLAKLQLELGNYAKADGYFRLAATLDSTCTAYERYFFANTRGNFYYHTKDYASALRWFRSADSITNAFSQPVYKAIVRGNMGEIFLLDGQPDSARRYLDDAWRLFGFSGPPGGGKSAERYYMEGLYASLALREGDLAGAERLLADRARKAFEVNPLYRYEDTRRMEELYARKGDYRAAYERDKLADRLEDSLRDVRVRNSLAEMAFLYRQDTALLRRDLQLVDAHAEMSSWRITALSCLLALLLSFSALFCWILYRRRRVERERWARTSAMNRLRMTAVRNRVTPHFIFNVLNAVLPSFRDHARLELPIRLLIKVLRGNLLFSERIAIPLSGEIELVGAYLRLRELGDPGRFRVVWELPERLPEHWLVPSMALQIPVENAVKHAFPPADAGAGAPGTIRIRVRADERALHLLVEDDGKGLGSLSRQGEREPAREEAERGTGSGLAILRQTVALLNARNREKISLGIADRGRQSAGAHGVRVEMVIPFNYVFDL